MCFFLKEQTLCTLGEAVRTVVPTSALAHLVEYYRPTAGMDAQNVHNLDQATLFAYQNAALALGSGSMRMWRATGMLAICFGIAAVREGFPQMLLHLAIAGWALTTMLGAGETEKEEN